MRTWYTRVRYYALTLAASSLFTLEGCGLSDQQLSSIWSSVLSTGLNTIVANVLQSMIDAQAGA
ncbi:MAG: hypothetical protein KA383_13285 [Phycisphaerae bacterium]|jgi:hypothetical protein|nr:hypothetical protein [Phycisphaerae bacterium]HQL55323.1 hypothetical protein [Phycisphaerae bacterium]